MSDISELAQGIGGLTGKIDQAIAETRSVAQEAEDTAAMAAAIGADGVAGGLGEVKEQLDALGDALKGASERATQISLLALSVSDGSATGGTSSAPHSHTPSSDPAAVPALAQVKPPARRRVSRRLAEAAEQSEGVGDLVSFTEKAIDGIAEFFKGPPKPPTVTGAGTRTPESPPIATGVGASGPDLPTAASGFATVGLLAFAGKYAVRRTIRGFRAQEQVPEEIPPPRRTRYPWEDEPPPEHHQ
jgi:hypothetical protein